MTADHRSPSKADAMPPTSLAPVGPSLPTPAEVGAWYDDADDLCKLMSGDSFHYGLWQPADLDSPLPIAQLATRAQNRMTDLFCDLLQLEAGQHLLDVGCGHGSPAIRAAGQRQCDVTGCSISRVQVQEATRRAAAAGLSDKVRFAYGDAMDLPYPDQGFDAVWALDSFPHLNDPVRGLRELTRAARPGAPILVTFYTQLRPATETELAMFRDFAFCPLPTQDQVLDQIHTAGLPLEHLRDLTEHITPTMRAFSRIYADNRPLVAERFGDQFTSDMDVPLANLLTFLSEKTGYLACLLRRPAQP
ncbi:SAM-dependent methyltransferase [Streptomyces sp. NPDC020379]|uniref:SAM-dependent methyltransferase n=1 Tax=Streptomyces sp. NPDC020379 TaxID=3365071 RepID=UPI0037BB95B0